MELRSGKNEPTIVRVSTARTDSASPSSDPALIRPGSKLAPDFVQFSRAAIRPLANDVMPLCAIPLWEVYGPGNSPGDPLQAMHQERRFSWWWGEIE